MGLNSSVVYAGSRMHVLDWVEGRGGDLVGSLDDLLRSTGVTICPEGPWRPKGHADAAEALLDRPCEQLLPVDVSRSIRAWWLAVDHPVASGPNWDLVLAATFPGSRRGLVLVEAKAHAGELKGEEGGKRLARDATPNSRANHGRIATAIAEARDALGGLPAGVGISRDVRYQFSNRVAFAWKLAAEGFPTVLVYLGFTGDEVIGRLSQPIHDDAHWRSLVAAHTATVLPADMWGRELDVCGTPLWLLVRSRPAYRLSPEDRSRKARSPTSLSANRLRSAGAERA